MRIGAGAKRAVLLFCYQPRTQASQSRYQGTHTPCGRISPFAYPEPTETVVQAPRFARHL